MKTLENLAPVVEGKLHVVVETPMGSQGKFTYNPELGLFELSHVLCSGMHFPFDFGFVPSTLGGDGDPLDALVLGDARVTTGTLLETRLIGAVEAEQADRAEEEQPKRNDRLVTVEVNAASWKEVDELAQLPEKLVAQWEHFFVSYNLVRGKKFKPLRRLDSEKAWEIVRKATRKAS